MNQLQGLEGFLSISNSYLSIHILSCLAAPPLDCVCVIYLPIFLGCEISTCLAHIELNSVADLY